MAVAGGAITIGEGQQPVARTYVELVIDLVGYPRLGNPRLGRRLAIGAARLQQAQPFPPDVRTPAVAERLVVLQPLAQPQLHPVGAIEETLLQPGAGFEPAPGEDHLLVRAQFGLAAGLEYRSSAADTPIIRHILLDREPQRLNLVATRFFAPAVRGIEGEPRVRADFTGGEHEMP